VDFDLLRANIQAGRGTIMTTQNILKEVRKLSLDDRLSLIRDILKTIEEEDDGFELTDDLKEMLLQSQEEHRKNPQDAIPWEDVKKELDSKYK
jgi:putative addiction module component (TIGR02574 family)